MLRDRVVAPLALLIFFLPALAGAASLELISKAPPRLAPDTAGGSHTLERPAISADSRYVAFLSIAPNLVPGQIDPNFNADVFLHDRAAGTTRLVSHAAGSPATAADRGSEQVSLSADGRFVAFVSAARNLVSGAVEDDDTRNVYLWDRETGETTLVSRHAGGGREGDGDSLAPSLSADGSVLVFTSQATDLIPGLDLTGSGENVYLYERASGTVSLVSRSAASASQPGNSSSGGATVSADGRIVAYVSNATNLVAGQNEGNHGGSDIFLFDRLTGATTLASHAAGSALTSGNGNSYHPSLSADGRYVAFESLAADLASGVSDTNARPDAFLYDRLLGTVSAVSLDGGFQPEISEDGGTVLYFTSDPHLTLSAQIIAYEVSTGARDLVTRAPESPFSHANRGSLEFSMSADGRIVAFVSLATNLVAGQEDAFPRGADVFVHDRATGTTRLVSHAAGSLTRTGDRGSYPPALSADGSWIAYVSAASDLVAGVRDAVATTDAFLYERATDANRILTLHAPGMASLTAPGGSQDPSISADGRYVAFVGNGPGLLPGLVVPEGRGNIYLHDRVTRQTVLVSRSARAPFAGGNHHSESPRISRDGSVVAFTSYASDLVPGQEDRAGSSDVFLWDRRTGRTTLVSHVHGSRTRAGGRDSRLGDVSADGNIVAFQSAAPDLVARQRDTDETFDVFVWDRRTGVTSLVSQPARVGDNFCYVGSLSPDGALLAFGCLGLNPDAYLYERRTRRISPLGRAGGPILISANGRWAALVKFVTAADSIVLLNRATGEALEVAPASAGSVLPLGLSDDGRWLLFRSDAPDLVPGQVDDEDSTDLFLFDRVSRQTRLVSHVPGDPLRSTGRDVVFASLSPNGRWVSFQSDSPLLLPAAGPDPVTNVFLYDRTTEDATLVSRSAADPDRGGNAPSSGQMAVINSGTVAFASQASNLVPRDFNFGNSDVFVYVPETP
ncbi:MAG TPA: hypothetical protein VIW92_15025 [Thermoanaerobaculia bacterium]